MQIYMKYNMYVSQILNGRFFKIQFPCDSDVSGMLPW